MKPLSTTSLRSVSRALRVAALACAAAAALPAWPQTILGWTGLGTAPRWSDPLNWGAGRPPVDGDSAVFGGSPSFASNAVDLSVALHSLDFAADAGSFAIRVAGDAANVLSFTGTGIQNLTAGSGGPFRQTLYAAAGTAGGTVLFANSSGINLGAPELYRGVDIVAQGGAAFGASGGHIVFQDDASTGTTTFNALRADGGSADGAGGGEVVFRGNAVATVFTTIALGGGSTPGAAGGRASFADGVRMDGSLAVLAGEGGGSGGRATFSGHAVAGSTSQIQNFGGNSFGGSAAGTVFRGDAVLAGSATNSAGNSAGAGGGQLEFRDRASFDGTGALGPIVIRNEGASADLAGTGRTVFADDSFARGANLLIVNATNPESDVSLGGSTEFRDRSRAGQTTIVNEGGSVVAVVGGPATQSGRTIFSGSASAENAQIQQNGGSALLALGGSVQFLGNATAAAARIDNRGGAVAGALGGTASFAGSANAGSATIVNGAGETLGASGGQLAFTGSSSAGSAYISNESRLGTGGGGGGSTRFADSASAGRATLDNRGGIDGPDRGRTDFTGNASAGTALITNFGGRGDGSGFINGGVTFFSDSSSASGATITNAGGNVAGAFGGLTAFSGPSTAADATISVFGGAASGAHGGYVSFGLLSSAGNARIGLDGAGFAAVGTQNGGQLYFDTQSTAANAVIVVGGGRVDGAQGGNALFLDANSAPGRAGPTAGNAGITVAGGQVAGALGGTLRFDGTNTTAGQAGIVNQGGSGSGGGGATTFAGHASAGSATITNLAGRNFGDGHTTFAGTSDAASSTIVVQGSTAATAGSGRAAYVVFTDLATAGRATLIAQGATVAGPGGAGGILQFDHNAQGGASRAVIEASSVGGAGGLLDVSLVNTGAITFGSIEGGGTVALGANRMYIGANGQQTTFSGLVRDGGLGGGAGGQLWVYGAGSLTLSGANSYSGGTFIGSSVEGAGGKLIVTNTTGSATGSGFVSVQSTGTLAGSGFIAGPVLLHAGGTIAPGDPVTLTIGNSLTWDGGGTIRLVLGADSANSDHLSVGSLIRGSDGVFLFDLVDWGITAGHEYDLLSFDQLVGFDADDFSVRGIDGIFSLDHGRLGFTAGAVAAVPEPATNALIAAGLLMMAAMARRRRRAAR